MNQLISELKAKDKVKADAFGREETFTVVRVDPNSKELNVLLKAEYDDLEIWVTDSKITKIDD